MAEAGPGTPFASRAPLDRVSEVAEELAALGHPLPTAWASDLHEALADARTDAQAAARAPQCGQRRKGGQTACDRPHGHAGHHSWAAERYRQMLHEYEHQALSELPAARREVARLTGQVARQAEQLQQWESKPRWRKRPKDDAERG